jgi:predicted transcriptional regulator
MVCAYHNDMAEMTIRSTYALDAETVRRLESLARRWEVSKSEALRRAIHAADAGLPQRSQLDALDALQSSLGLSSRRAAAWADDARGQRAAIKPRPRR